MITKLIRGPSKQSKLLVATDNIHFFVWAPSLGADSFGFTIRWRRGEDWTHHRLIVLQRNHRPRQGGSMRAGKWVARRTLTLAEWSRWRTKNGVSEREGLKQYLRLKGSAGGRQVVASSTHAPAEARADQV